MKNQFLALVLGLLTLSAIEAQCSIRTGEANSPAQEVGNVPTGPSIPYVMTMELLPAVSIDIEAGEAPKAPDSIGLVLAGYTSELVKPPNSKLIRPAYRSWLCSR